MTRTPQARASEHGTSPLEEGVGPIPFYNTFYHRVVQIPPKNSENIFLIVLMFQAMTSKLNFFLENSFLLLDWDWEFPLVTGPGE